MNNKFRIVNKERLLFLTYLILIYGKFSEKKLLESIMKTEMPSYEEQEKAHMMFNSLFNIDADIKLRDDNEYADKCIKLNDSINRYLHDIVEYTSCDKDTVMSFLNHAENSSALIWLKVNSLKYQYLIGILFSYVMGLSSKEEYDKSVIFYETAPFPLQCNVNKMLKYLYTIESEYNAILRKRCYRKFLKSKLISL